MNSKEKILNKITAALRTKSELREPVGNIENEISTSLRSITPQDNGALWEQFKTELEKIAGEYKSFSSIEDASRFVIETLTDLKINAVGIDNSATAVEMQNKLAEANIAAVKATELTPADRKKILAEINCSIVGPAFAVADIGSIVFTMDDVGTSYPHFLCDNTIAIIKKDRITANQFELFDKIDPEKAKNMFFVTGPSRTADIEKVLVLGAHGPRKLIVIAID
jgi:L-lactate dehydrogenase complex protein LldG